MTSLGLKPHLLRADTIDLQSQQSPSAKDHSRGPYNGYINVSQNNTGPHHAQALRNANQDAYQERHTSPRLGGFDQSGLGHSEDNHMYDEGDEEDEDHMHNHINGHNHHDDGYDDGDPNDSLDEDMDDELLDKISSSPSIEDEDIDFEFVYALHTFVATVEGQANATKGDTMVLLDDTNSYWWLVRVVKDGSIGYLPAEHIETPTERLARLNKHRNVDLSQTMLGDNPEKSKNPLKKAMRRRNAKTVNFAPPTYYEPEEREWSDEDEVNDVEDGLMAQHIETGNEEPAQTQESVQSQAVQQVKPTIEQQRAEPSASIVQRVSSEETTREKEEPSSPVKADVQAPAPLQINSQEAGSRLRKGVMRNTDSFFKDENVETKKISLTPRLLRGDSDSIGSTSIDQESVQRPSFDGSEKSLVEDKGKEGKKKEKKGMLSGLFKRKDKGGKSGKTEADGIDRISDDMGRPSKDTIEGDTTPDRKLGKLQKTPPSTISPKQSPIEAKTPPRELNSSTVLQGQLETRQPDTTSYGPSLDYSPSTDASQNLSAGQQNPSKPSSGSEKRSIFAPLTGALRSRSSNQDDNDSGIKPIYVKKAKERFAIDDSDSDDASTPTAQSSILHRSISPPDTNSFGTPQLGSDRTVSPLNSHYHNLQPSESAPAAKTAEPVLSLVSDEKTEAHRYAMVDTTTASPSERTASTSKHSPSVATHTPSTSRSTPTWSDASLRSYMDNDQDIRDLLVIVHDKSNVQPVPADHPLMNGLFSTERSKLADMQTQLDTMLMTWISKKNQTVSARN